MKWCPWSKTIKLQKYIIFVRPDHYRRCRIGGLGRLRFWNFYFLLLQYEWRKRDGFWIHPKLSILIYAFGKTNKRRKNGACDTKSQNQYQDHGCVNKTKTKTDFYWVKKTETNISRLSSHDQDRIGKNKTNAKAAIALNLQVLLCSSLIEHKMLKHNYENRIRRCIE